MAPDILIPNSSIKSSSAGPMTIDKMEVGAVSIPTVDMKNFKGAFSYASSVAKDVQVQMEISVCSTFCGVVCVPWPICCVGVSGGISISTYTQTTCVGDVAVDGGSFCMVIPDSDFGPFNMTVPPTGKTTVAKVEVTDICMKGTEVPMPSPLGITLGDSFPIPNPTGPMDVSVKETVMNDLDSTCIAVPAASIKNVSVMNIKIPSVTTKPMTIVSPTPISVPMSVPLYDNGSCMGSKVTQSGSAQCEQITTDMTINISSVTMNIRGGIEFKCVQGNVTTSSASAGPFEMNMDMKCVRIKGLTLLGMKMPEIEVQL
jgi:hypothetical protein